MSVIDNAIKQFKTARKGEEVRDALVEVALISYKYGIKAITIGTDVVDSNSSTDGYLEGMKYLNKDTYDLFSFNGTSWELEGNLKGEKGEDGNSLTVDSVQIENGVKITFIDEKTGEEYSSYEVHNGADGYTPQKGIDYFDGQDGKDGVSLTVEHSKSGLVTTVTIKNAETGAVIDTFEIYDGKSGTGTGDMLESDFVGESATKSVHKADSVEWSGVKNKPTIPSKTSDLQNDSHFVADENYQHITIDSELSKTSENPVQNKVIAEKFEKPTDLEKGIVGGDAYVSGKTYSENETCIYNNKIYACKATTTALPTDTNYWEETSLRALNSKLGSGGIKQKQIHIKTDSTGGYILPSSYGISKIIGILPLGGVMCLPYTTVEGIIVLYCIDWRSTSDYIFKKPNFEMDVIIFYL